MADMEQAIALANDSSLGLTGSVWSSNTRAAVALGRRIHAGVITINDHLLTHGMAETPWGGVKESGIGRSHGELGFDEMTPVSYTYLDVYKRQRYGAWLVAESGAAPDQAGFGSAA